MIRILFLILVLYACSKEKQAYNKLDGIWEVTQARIVDGQGFTFYDDSPTGTIEFKSNTKVFSATFAFSYENLSEVPLIIYDTLDYNSATFVLNNKGEQYEKNNRSTTWRINEFTVSIHKGFRLSFTTK